MDRDPCLPVSGRSHVQDKVTEAETPEPTAMVASGPAMIDSGVGKHLTCKKLCSAEELDNATHTNVVLLTAKGEERVSALTRKSRCILIHSAYPCPLWP